MQDFNVLFTCCAMHVKERIDSLKQNEEGARVDVIAVNNNAFNLPPKGMADACYVVPSIYDENYLPALDEIIERHGISIIVPTVTLELALMAEKKPYFERRGVKVSVSSPEAIAVANNKLEMAKRFPEYMPKQIFTDRFDDVVYFKSTLPKDVRICTKLTDHCGGNGFAIVDDEKSLDVTLFNKYAENRYVSMDELRKIMERGTSVIVQEFKEGYDYSVSALCVDGEVTHMVGYVGYVMSFGAIVKGAILHHEEAYRIVRRLCREIGLDGNVCFDFRLDADNNVTLLEINPRVNASLPFLRAAGINLLYLRCKNLLGDYSDVGKDFPINDQLKMAKFYDTTYFV